MSYHEGPVRGKRNADVAGDLRPACDRPYGTVNPRRSRAARKHRHDRARLARHRAHCLAARLAADDSGLPQPGYPWCGGRAARIDDAFADARNRPFHPIRDGKPCAGLRAAAFAIAGCVPAGLLDAAAAGPGRATLRPGDQADAGNRRFRRYPVSGRGAAQEACRDLLAAERGGLGRRSAWRVRGTHADLALSAALARRGGRDRPADLLGAARLRPGQPRAPGRSADGGLRTARRGSADREDGRRAGGLRGGELRRAGAGLARLDALARLRPEFTELVGVLGRDRDRASDQGPDRADGLGSGDHRPEPSAGHIPVAQAASLRPRPAAVSDRRDALVRRDHDEERRQLPRRQCRPGHARQGRRGSGEALGPARPLPC